MGIFTYYPCGNGLLFKHFSVIKIIEFLEKFAVIGFLPYFRRGKGVLGQASRVP
jgi:hypothetical protein